MVGEEQDPPTCSESIESSSDTSSPTALPLLPVKPPKSRKRIDSSCSTFHTPTSSALTSNNNMVELQTRPPDTLASHSATTSSHPPQTPSSPHEEVDTHSRPTSSTTTTTTTTTTTSSSSNRSDRSSEESSSDTSPAASEATLIQHWDGVAHAKTYDGGFCCRRSSGVDVDVRMARRASVDCRAPVSGCVGEMLEARGSVLGGYRAVEAVVRDSDTGEQGNSGRESECDAVEDGAGPMHQQRPSGDVEEQSEERGQVDEQGEEELLEWLVDPPRTDEKDQPSLSPSTTLQDPDHSTAPTPAPIDTSTLKESATTTIGTINRQSEEPVPHQQKHSVAESDSAAAAPPRLKGLWGLLSGSASSSKPTPSASPTLARPLSLPAATTAPPPSNRLSTSPFSLFTLKPTPTSTTTTTTTTSSSSSSSSSSPPHPPTHPTPHRLPRTPLNETKQTSLILTCADTRHILKTSTSPTVLKQVGLKLERCFKEQLAETQDLRARWRVARDTVGDLEDENRHLREQLGKLSEEVVLREEEVERVRREGERERERERVGVEVERRVLGRRLMEEKSFAVGLGVMLCEQRRKGGGEEGGSSGQSVSSVLFENDVDQLVRLRCEAQAQARPLDTEDDAFNYDYEDLFRCPLHRFPHAAAAPPSTLVDERVLLIGTDQRLLASLVQRLTTLGLSRIVVALPGSSVASPKRIGARVVTFDPEATVAWTELINNSGGEVDCVVNAFDRLDVDKLASVCRFITQQYLTASSENGNKQAMSIVNVAYDDALTCTMALIGLSHTLCLSTPTPSTRPVRLNTLINPTNHPPAIETILRLIDPCSSTNGCVLHVDEQHLRCLGPPLCNASAIKGGGGKVGLLSRAVGEGVVGGEGWLRQRKRMVDVELMEALERENDALRERVEVLESEAAVKDVVDVK